MTREDIIKTCALAWSVSVQDMLSADKHRNIAEARQYACWIMSRYLGHSSTEIGRTVGRTHATVLYAFKVVEDWEKMPKYFPLQNKRMKLVKSILKL